METLCAGDPAPAHEPTVAEAFRGVKTMVCRALHIVHRMVEARTPSSTADQGVARRSRKRLETQDVRARQNLCRRGGARRALHAAPARSGASPDAHRRVAA